MKLTNSLAVTLLALISEVVLAWFGKPTGAATIAAGLYVGSRAGAKASHVWAASKDPEANTSEIIDKLK
jgi:hypothetical protein